MNRPSRQSSTEFAFRDAVDVEVCETGHGLSENCVQFFILDICPSTQFRPLSDEL